MGVWVGSFRFLISNKDCDVTGAKTIVLRSTPTHFSTLIKIEAGARKQQNRRATASSELISLINNPEKLVSD